MKLRTIDKNGGAVILFKSTIAWINGQDEYCYLKNDEIIKISEEDYLGSYAGKHWEKINKTSNGFGTSGCLTESGSFFSIHYQNGCLNCWDEQGDLIDIIELGEIIGRGHLIYDIEFQKPNFIWLAFPTGQTVAQFDWQTKKEVFRIGDYTYDEKYEPLSYPETLFSDKDNLYISCMGSGEIYKLNFKTKELILYKTVGKPLWEFVKSGNREFVVIEKELFELTD